MEERGYQEPACQQAIEDMRECCRKWGKESFVCGGIDAENKEKSPKNTT